MSPELVSKVYALARTNKTASALFQHFKLRKRARDTSVHTLFDIINLSRKDLVKTDLFGILKKLEEYGLVVLVKGDKVKFREKPFIMGMAANIPYDTSNALSDVQGSSRSLGNPSTPTLPITLRTRVILVVSDSDGNDYQIDIPANLSNHGMTMLGQQLIKLGQEEVRYKKGA